jgi:hypothetical protein
MVHGNGGEHDVPDDDLDVAPGHLIESVRGGFWVVN